MIASYELGNASKDLIYACGDSGKDVAIHHTLACTELGDLICQALIAFGKLRLHSKTYKDMSPEDFILEGMHRQQEHMEGLQKKGGACFVHNIEWRPES
jgi:hypothetical protein